MKESRMRCEALEEIIFSGRDATQQERRAMEEHARGCAACRALMENADVLRGARALDADMEVPAGFSQGWRRAVRLSPQRRTLAQRAAELMSAHPRGRMAARLAAYACCAAVLVGVGAGLGGDRMEAQLSGGVMRRSSYVMEAGEADYEYADTAAPGAGLYANEADAGSSAQAQSRILRTARLSLRTADLDAALLALRERAAALGGSVTSCSVLGEKGSSRSAELELSIPAEALDGFLTGAGELGTVTGSHTYAEDVTASYQDNASRLESARAQKQRLDELYAQAEDMEDIVTLTDAIFAVQQEIDALEGKNRSIDARAAHAQVSVSLTERAEEPEQLTLIGTLQRRLMEGLEALGGFAGALLEALAWALPWLGAAAVLAAAVLGLRRWRRGR